jgi:hypothetical protein
MHFLVNDCGLAGVGGVLVVRGGIEFLSHVEPPWQDNVAAITAFPAIPATPQLSPSQDFSPHVQYRADRELRLRLDVSR